MIVFLCIPQYMPVTATDMNYTVVVIAAVALIFTVNWFLHAKKNYHFSTTALTE